MLACCRIYNQLTVHEFEIYYPPKNLDQNREGDWIIYAEKIRTLMSKCLGIPGNPINPSVILNLFIDNSSSRKRVARVFGIYAGMQTNILTLPNRSNPYLIRYTYKE